MAYFVYYFDHFKHGPDVSIYRYREEDEVYECIDDASSTMKDDDAEANWLLLLELPDLEDGVLFNESPLLRDSASKERKGPFSVCVAHGSDNDAEMYVKEFCRVQKVEEGEGHFKKLAGLVAKKDLPSPVLLLVIDGEGKICVWRDV